MSKTNTDGLEVAQNLILPVELAARTQVILAQKGAGKTYTAMRQSEQLLAANQQIVALDPTGVWWGLRSPAAGGGRGFPIVVMGGDNADLPLERDAGGIVAKFVATSRQSVVLDLSGFESNAAQNHFVTEFAERLYRVKASDRRTVHVMLDEADSFCPQRPQPGEQRMLGAFEAIVRRGRSRGLGITLISQRPAVLNKNVMSQADLLVCLRVVGTHDHKALREWTNLYASKEQQKEFMESLPKLQTGEAWFWSPSWLNIFQRAKVTKRVSFDSSATPDASATQSAPARAVKVDLDALSEELRAMAERAEANDPEKLQERIEELEDELTKLRQESDAKATVPKEVPVISEHDMKRLEDMTKIISEALGKRTAEITSQIRISESTANGHLEEICGHLAKYASMQKNVHTVATAPAVSGHHFPKPAAGRNSGRTDRAANAGAGPTGSAGVGKGEIRVLTAVAQHGPEGVTREQLTVLTGFKRSTRDAYLQRLRGRGFTTENDGEIKATGEGVDALGAGFQPLPIGAALLSYWQANLPEGERRVLDCVVALFPNAAARDAISDSTGFRRSTRDAYIQRLKSRQLLRDGGGGAVRATALLFDQ